MPHFRGCEVPSSVSPRYLLEGAVYALEQCGLLLRDANLLYGSGSYASAVALTAFAREELGRWKILLDLRRKVLAGERLTIEEVQNHCEGHVRKQEAGMTSITMRADRDSGLGKLLQTRTNTTPGTEEWNASNEQVEKLDRQRKRRVPDDRHKQRMSALYVDAVSLDRWNRPGKEISQPFARDFLIDAVNDYSIQYSQGYTELEIRIKHDDPELFHALEQWSDRPELPRPEWPLGEAMGESGDNPGVIAPPPLIALATLLLGLALDWLVPSFILRGLFGFWTRLVFGGILIAAGIGIAIFAVRSFRRAGTNVEPWKPTVVLVTDGIFNFMRNPIYTSMIMFLAGLGIALGSDWTLVLVVPAALILHFGVVKREEHYLEAKFGESYRSYIRRVPRYWM